MIADFFAVPATPRLTRHDHDKVAALLDRILQATVEAAERLEGMSTLTAREGAAAVMGLLDEAIAAFSPPWVPKKKRGIGVFTEQIRSMRKRPVSTELRATGYRLYQRGIRKLIADLHRQGRLALAYDLWNGISQQQGIVQFQPLFRLRTTPAASRRLRSILTRRSRATMQDVQALLEVFRILAGMYERHLRTLAALVDLERGNVIDSAKVSELPLARAGTIISENVSVAPIARRFDRRLRNAVAHDDIAVTPRLGKITLRDRHMTRTVQPQHLANELRETVALVTALLEIPFAIFERTIFASNTFTLRTATMSATDATRRTPSSRRPRKTGRTKATRRP